MNAELLAMLGGQMPPPSSSSRNREAEGKTILSFKAGKMKTELQPNGKYLVTPDNRRGQVNLVWQAQPSSGSGGSGGSGGGGVLKFEWKDRRTRTVVDSLSVFPEDGCTYTKVPTGRDGDRVFLLQYGRSSDRRFFFWMQDKWSPDKDKENAPEGEGEGEGGGGKVGGPEKDAELDEANRKKVAKFLSDPAAAREAAGGGGSGEGGSGGAAAASGGASGGGGAGIDTSAALGGGGTALDNAALMQIMQGLGGGGGGSGSAGGSGSGGVSGAASTSAAAGSAGGGGGGAVQADALSNILQNLGAGSSGGGSGAGSASGGGGSGSEGGGASAGAGAESSAPAPAPAAAGGGGAGTLTLADLQGAMAGLATSSPTATPAGAAAGAAGPPLSELVTSDAVDESGILSDPAVRARLIDLLPEGQRTEEMLRENLRSPQVAQCLKSLTAALAGDGPGGGGEFNSIIANFSLKPEDGAGAMAAGNPIQAFLDCVLKSVEREKAEAKEKKGGGGEEKDEGKEEEEGKDGDDKMEEGD